MENMHTDTKVERVNVTPLIFAAVTSEKNLGTT